MEKDPTEYSSIDTNNDKYNSITEVESSNTNTYVTTKKTVGDYNFSFVTVSPK